jgi:hypothetical protein
VVQGIGGGLPHVLCMCRMGISGHLFHYTSSLGDIEQPERWSFSHSHCEAIYFNVPEDVQEAEKVHFKIYWLDKFSY